MFQSTPHFSNINQFFEKFYNSNSKTYNEEQSNVASSSENTNAGSLPKNQQIEKIRGMFYRIFSKDGKEEVGYLLGTIHVANKKMLQLNPSIRQALEKAANIYSETEPSILQRKAIDFPKDMTESHKEKIENFAKLLWPYLIDKLKKENVPKLEALIDQFKSADLNTKWLVCHGILNQLQLHEAEVVFYSDVDVGGHEQTAIGIDYLLMAYGMTHNKLLFPLEEDTSERLNLLDQRIETQYFSKEAIESLPASKEEIETYISKKLRYIKDQCESWTMGNGVAADDDIDDESFHFKLTTERDEGMGSKIDKVLSVRKDQDTDLFAIGCAHIEGVVRRLEQKGWIVKRD